MPKRSAAEASDAAAVGATMISTKPGEFLPLADGAVAVTLPSRSRSRTVPARGEDAEAAPSSSSSELSSVVYIGHIPHGFYEKQLLGFFSQFGKLVQVRLSRSKKSGRSKHYAFLRFQHQAVAEIAAEAMDGYFLMKNRLQCRVLKKSEVHPNMFVGANRTFHVRPWRALARSAHDRERTPEEHATLVSRAIRKDRKRQAKIAAAGIDFTYEGLATKLPVKATKIVFDE